MRRFAILRPSLSAVSPFYRSMFISGENGHLPHTSEGDINVGEHEFRTLELYPKKQSDRRSARRRVDRPKPPTPPRYTRLPSDGSWSDVWPTAQSFRASVVPLPIRMGHSVRNPAPGKYGNAELMKIPNFLHLTPPAIEKHCKAIKKFCTEWPVGLETDESIEHHFPLSVTTYDYCFSGPSIRNPAARIVTLQLRLSSIGLDEHAKDKLLRIVGERYDLRTNTLTLVADRCPMKKQNYDYALYLLTALFHESWKTENWESEKEESDMEFYVWDGSKSQSNILRIVQAAKEAEKTGAEPTPITSSLRADPTDEDILALDAVSAYGRSVARIHNEGEDQYTLRLYKESVKGLLNLGSPSDDLERVAEVSTTG